MADEADFGALIEAVAREFWGDPNPKLTKPKVELRWGSGGAKVVDLVKGTWFDHQRGEGGGTIALVMAEKSCIKAEAIRWLEEEEFIPEREMEPKRQEPERVPDEAPDDAPDRAAEDGKKTEFETYTYVNRDGEAIYQVVRFQFQLPDGSWEVDPKTGTPKKTFAQRRRDHTGDVVWNLQGIGHSIYRHNKVELAIAEGKTVFLPEGEKDVRTFEQWELVGSTNSGGAKNWTPKLAALFQGADVVIPIDNDDVGRARGEAMAKSLRGIARRIRVLDFAKVVPGFPEKHDVTDWRDAGGTKEKLLELVDRLPDWTPAPPVSRHGAQQFQDIGKSGIAYDWLIKGLIERAGVFMVAGEMQSGKSFLTIDMGMKVARGDEYCGRKVKQGLVIYVACEDGNGVKLRVEGYRREHNLDAKEVPFLVMTKKLSLLEDKSIDDFIDECLAWEEWYGLNLELIFIDTFSTATEGLDEINGAETGKVLGRVNRIVERTGAAVGLVHHLNARGERVRGHSSLTANVSQVIELRPLQELQLNRNLPPKYIFDDDKRLIRQAVLVKNKNGANQTKWRFVLRQIQLGVDADGYPITTCICAPVAGDRKAPEDTGTRLSPDQKLVLKALEEAIEDAGTDMPSGVRVGPQIKRCVANAAWVERVRKQWSFKAPEEELEARQKELQDVMARTSKALLNGEFIGRDNDRKIAWSLGRIDRPRKEPKAEPARPEISEGMREAIDEGVPF